MIFLPFFFKGGVGGVSFIGKNMFFGGGDFVDLGMRVVFF